MHFVLSERPLLHLKKTISDRHGSTAMLEYFYLYLIQISISPIFTLKSQHFRNDLPSKKLHTARVQLWGIYFSDIFVLSLPAVSDSKA